MDIIFTEKLPRDLTQRAQTLTEMGIVPLCLAEQVHGGTILYADERYAYTEGDALYTDRPGLYVGVKTADCVPILLHSPKVVAAVHAGWRGTAMRLASKTAALLCERFGLSPEDITAYIGPCICQSCYEAGPEVAEALGPEADAHIGRHGEKCYPDLRRINELWLREAGLLDIRVATDCTRCRPDVYWSHRAHGTERGVQVSAVRL